MEALILCLSPIVEVICTHFLKFKKYIDVKIRRTNNPEKASYAVWETRDALTTALLMCGGLHLPALHPCPPAGPAGRDSRAPKAA